MSDGQGIFPPSADDFREIRQEAARNNPLRTEAMNKSILDGYLTSNATSTTRLKPMFSYKTNRVIEKFPQTVGAIVNMQVEDVDEVLDHLDPDFETWRRVHGGPGGLKASKRRLARFMGVYGLYDKCDKDALNEARASPANVDDASSEKHIFAVDDISTLESQLLDFFESNWDGMTPEKAASRATEIFSRREHAVKEAGKRLLEENKQ